MAIPAAVLVALASTALSSMGDKKKGEGEMSEEDRRLYRKQIRESARAKRRQAELAATAAEAQREPPAMPGRETAWSQ